MKKLSTLFRKDPNDLGRVIDQINPENEWVFEFGIPTRKFDGTACAVIKSQLYKRYDSKINKKTGIRKPVPKGAIACQEPDNITGHWPHWIKCIRGNPENKYHFEAFDKLVEYYSQNCFTDKEFTNKLDGTYELCGKKIQGNPEDVEGHLLIKHGSHLLVLPKYEYYESFDIIKEYLTNINIEGIVFHHELDDRMCKIRKSDFGIKR